MLDPQDLQSIVNQILQSQPMQWVIQQMQNEASNSSPEAAGFTPQANDQQTQAGGAQYGGGSEVPQPQMQPQLQQQPQLGGSGACPTCGQATKPQSPQQPQQPHQQYQGGANLGAMQQSYSANAGVADGAGDANLSPAELAMRRAAQLSEPVDAAIADRKTVDKYSAVQAENERLRKAVEQANADKTAAIRRAEYSKLKEAGYVLDIDQEMKHSAQFSDDQFQSHLTLVASHYSRAPIGRDMIPVEDSPKPESGSAGDAGPSKYSMQARAYCLSKLNEGVKVEYGKALELAKAGQLV